MLVLDTSGLLSAIDEDQIHHGACAAALAEDGGPFFLSPFVLGEMDYLLSTRIGVRQELVFLSEVVRGAYRLEPFDRDDVRAAMQLVEKYEHLGIGIADASVVVLAARWNTDRLLTLDERHFRPVAPLTPAGSFKLIPADQ